jgi:hypothetical protein
MRFSILLLISCLGCTYYTGAENTIYEVLPDAGGDDMKSTSGGAKSVVLTRGQFQPVALGNYVFNDAGVYTIQFSTIPVGGPAVPSFVRPSITYAIVKWTVAGNDIQRIVSVANGVSLAGVGEGCTIQVFDATAIDPPPNPDPMPQYTVTATLTPGTRGSAVNPPTYFPSVFDPNTKVASYGDLLASSSAVIPVPQNAGVISVQVTGVSGNPADPLLLNVVQYNPVTNLRAYSAAVYTGFIPLDPGATFVNINNEDAAHDALYGVAFGVDG